MSVGSPAASAPAASWGTVHGASGVLDGLIHGEDQAGRLGRRRQGVDADNGRLPDARRQVVCDVLVVDVYSVPHTTLDTEREIW